MFDASSPWGSSNEAEAECRGLLSIKQGELCVDEDALQASSALVNALIKMESLKTIATGTEWLLDAAFSLWSLILVESVGFK